MEKYDNLIREFDTFGVINGTEKMLCFYDYFCQTPVSQLNLITPKKVLSVIKADNDNWEYFILIFHYFTCSEMPLFNKFYKYYADDIGVEIDINEADLAEVRNNGYIVNPSDGSNISFDSNSLYLLMTVSEFGKRFKLNLRNG